MDDAEAALWSVFYGSQCNHSSIKKWAKVLRSVLEDSDETGKVGAAGLKAKFGFAKKAKKTPPISKKG